MKIYELSRNSRRKIGEAIHDFNLIKEGDRILVGLSGGKDSVFLLASLKGLQSRSPVHFDIEACTLDPTDGAVDLTPLSEFCLSQEVPFTVMRVPLFRLIGERNEKSPCSFCANMRRGTLSTAARERGFTSLCLGHHLDDVVETTLLNLLFAGTFRCFSPLTWQDRTEIKVIRPLVYLEESQINHEVQRLALPVLDFLCPFSANSERTWVKSQVATMSRVVNSLKPNVLHALQSRGDFENPWRKSEE